MQREEAINNADVNKIVDAIYAIDEPQVSEAYSQYDENIVYFNSPTSLMNYINEALARNEKILLFAIYYPETNGFVGTETIKLDPRKCKGHTFRFYMKGWGVIQFQLDYRKSPNVKCRFAVNSEKRANAWFDTLPTLKSPSLWDWKMVEKHTRRLIRELKKYGTEDFPIS